MFLLRTNLHVGANVFDNPMNASIKESELSAIKFGFDDDEHIYDDPNLLCNANSLPESPEPYNVACTSTKDQAELQPSLAAAAPSKESDSISEPRYMSISEKTSLSSVAASPNSTLIPQDYSTPMSPCVPQHPENPTPEHDDCYDDCLSSPATTQPSSKPTAAIVTGIPQSYSNPVYASPNSVGCLESQIESNLEITTSSVKTRMEMEKEDGEEQSMYYPLRMKSMQKAGVYQELSVVMKGSTPNADGNPSIEKNE